MNSAVCSSTPKQSPIVEVQWTTVCREDDLFAEAGICVLFDGEQVAIFKDGKSQQVFAVSNYDPIGKANVLSRGIVGSINGRLVVASPLYKQHFCLDTGACLEAEHQLKTYPIRVNDGDVQLSQPLA